MPNRLAAETSPYLLQHAENPVDWYPWGEEALRTARESGKPILLSVGYSACHWCHVMAHECFEDPEVAAVMNELFVNVKVDREERPDIDQVYQAAHQLLAQRAGGWPLTMFLTADQVPFFGGTYFPKEPRYGLPGFVDLLRRVRAFHDERREAVAAQNGELVAALARTQPRGGAHPSEFSDAPLAEAFDFLVGIHDGERGGFGKAPKFPHPDMIETCLRHWARTGEAKALGMATATLARMAEGGVFDQLGGGFARYSTDDDWAIPHFEKMLYDNGPLLRLYADAWAVTGEPLFARAVEGTAAWVMREMQSAEGGYFSALDADSEGEEGRFYVWTREEVEAALSPEERAVVIPHYGFDRPPNFEGRAWNPVVARPLADIAAELGMPGGEAAAHLASARAKLLAVRERRVRPGRDDKILTAWNALMIGGMARAARVFGREDWLASARRALDFLHAAMWDGERLLAARRGDLPPLPGYLDDYAFLLAALLEMAQADFRPADIEWAEALGDALLESFHDDAGGGFFFTAHGHERLILRPKPGHDNATPSGNGVAAWALNRLSYLSGETRFRNAAEGTIALFWPALERSPTGFGSLLAALEETIRPPTTVIVNGPEEALAPWREALRGEYLPSALVLFTGSAAGMPPPLAKPAGPAVNAWVCEGVTCLAPVGEPGRLRETLNAPKMPGYAPTPNRSA
ncbi:MAG: thioredoxin domain-containing protein [Burkholderiales bacterium]|nr:thioredoxin domain-containing protein [Burkholderiales bacterium]